MEFPKLFLKISILLIFILIVYSVNIILVFDSHKILYVDSHKVYFSIPFNKVMIPSKCDLYVDKVEEKNYTTFKDWKIYNVVSEGITELTIKCVLNWDKRIQIFNLNHFKKGDGGCKDYYFLNELIKHAPPSNLKEAFERVLKIKSKLSQNLDSKDQQIILEDISEVLKNNEGSCGSKSAILHDLLCALNYKGNVTVGLLISRDKKVYYHGLYSIKDGDKVFYIDPTTNSFFYIDNFIPVYNLSKKMIKKPFQLGDTLFFSVDPFIFVDVPYDALMDTETYFIELYG